MGTYQGNNVFAAKCGCVDTENIVAVFKVYVPALDAFAGIEGGGYPAALLFRADVGFED
jgi:hypothetical protein